MDIENAELVTDIFGRWPSFHDGYLRRCALDTSREDGGSLEVEIHAFRMTDEVDADGHVVLADNTLVRIEFRDIGDFVLRDWKEGNIILDVDIAEVAPGEHDDRRFKVCINPSYGAEAEFRCAGIRVLSVEPCDPPRFR